MHPVPVPAHREPGRQLHRRGRPQVDPGRHGGGGDLGQHRGRGQPRLPEPGGHGVVPRGQQPLREPVLEPRLQPRPLVHRVGPDRQVQHRNPSQVRRLPRRDPRRLAGQAELRQNQRRHHLGRDRHRPLEQPPLVLQGAGDVVVDAVDGGLLLAADHEHRRPHHHERPQHRGLLIGQRPQSVKRAYRGQHRAGFGPGVPQHRGDRHGELADRPRAGQVAEVDDPVRRPQPPLEAADHVVVGHVAVHGLPRQPSGQRLDPAPGRRGRVRHPRPQPGVPHVPGQRVHQAQRVPQVPLQHPVEPGMVEGAQRQAHLPGHRAQARDHPRRQVAPRARERAAGQVAQHPRDGGLALDRHLDRPVRHGRDPQVLARPGDVRGRAVLRLDLGRAERRVRDLEYPQHAAAVNQQEVAVLLTTQRLHAHREAERGRDPFGLLVRHLRYRQRAVPEEIDPGHPRAHGAKTTRPTVSPSASRCNPAGTSSRPSRSPTSGLIAPSATSPVSWA